MGHIVPLSGVTTGPEKLEAVKKWPRPTDKPAEGFLGLCTYYRRSIAGFVDVGKPLIRLTEEKRTFEWSPAAKTAFQPLKEALCTAPIVGYPRPGEFIDTDAINVAIGGVLSHVQDGSEWVVAYFSKTLFKADRNYCVTPRELLAVVKTLENFHKYLYVQEFRLCIDHSTLTWLLSFMNLEGQRAQWVQRLQEYNFTSEYRHQTHKPRRPYQATVPRGVLPLPVG